jgi:histidine triad (HIT) family protein
MVDMQHTIFHDIVAGKIPSHKVYETDNFFAFLDIFPRTKGHTLVVPKTPCQWVYDVPNFGEYWETVLKITKAMQKTLEPSFVTYATHGLEIRYAHIHILPRYGKLESPKHKVFPQNVMNVRDEELAETAEKIRKGF